MVGSTLFDAKLSTRRWPLEESCLWAGRQYKGGEGTAPVKGSIFKDIVFPGVARKGSSSKSKDHKETAWC
jgi:hypothetical protein